MKIRNSPTHYGLVSRFLHWLLAAAILTLIPIGWYLTQLNNESVRYWRLLELHETVGLCVLILFLIKLGWRFISPNPDAVPDLARWERVLARVVHSFFLCAFALLPVSGYIYIASGNDPIELYRLITLPALPSLTKSTSEFIYTVHSYTAYTCATLVLVHIIAALKHHFADGNTVLKRMLY